MRTSSPDQHADPRLVLADGNEQSAIPVWLVAEGDLPSELTQVQRTWIAAQGFKGQSRRHVTFPDAAGAIGGVLLGLGVAEKTNAADAAASVGLLPAILPSGSYRLVDNSKVDAELAAVAWGLGAYRFRRYKTGNADPAPILAMGDTIDRARARNTVEAMWLARDMINTPANDMGPAEIEAAARDVASRHGAEVTSIIGDDLLAKNFPLIHAVGRASSRPPRLVDISWGRKGAPTVTLVGKGIAFDTGGLDIKPASGMLLMKKDMGGAAAALATAHMLMGQRLDLRVRVILAIAENAISADAFRPGDIITSRSGRTVEIGNTDAEGRLVLADALTLADEDAPDLVVTFATLTGAARIALGPDLPPLFTDDDALAEAIVSSGLRVADPVWRMPFATPYYDAWLDNSVADFNNVAEGGFAGATVGALFLRRFVKRARRFAHFDIFGWRPQPKPLGPKGGEAQAARAVVELLRTWPLAASRKT